MGRAFMGSWGTESSRNDYYSEISMTWIHLDLRPARGVQTFRKVSAQIGNNDYHLAPFSGATQDIRIILRLALNAYSDCSAVDHPVRTGERSVHPVVCQ